MAVVRLRTQITAGGSSTSPTVTTTPVTADTVVWGAFAHEEENFTVGSGYTASTTDLEGGEDRLLLDSQQSIKQLPLLPQRPLMGH